MLGVVLLRHCVCVSGTTDETSLLPQVYNSDDFLDAPCKSAPSVVRLKEEHCSLTA